MATQIIRKIYCLVQAHATGLKQIKQSIILYMHDIITHVIGLKLVIVVLMDIVNIPANLVVSTMALVEASLNQEIVHLVMMISLEVLHINEEINVNTESVQKLIAILF